jgi:ubiquinone/menaquinone biosynthesis C-methylase UbiE
LSVLAADPSATPASVSSAYDAGRASDLGRITDKLEEALILESLARAQGLRVLDVGCGDGFLAVRQAESGAELTGIDAEARMLAAAQERADVTQMPLRLIEGDACELPLADATFDVVVAVTVRCSVPNAQPVLREIARVMRPGGRLVIGELGRHSLWAAKRRISGWLGSTTWRSAIFRSGEELKRLARGAEFDVTGLRGAIYYPPWDACARCRAPIDPWLGRMSTFGAAVLTLSATKPNQRQTSAGMPA